MTLLTRFFIATEAEGYAIDPRVGPSGMMPTADGSLTCPGKLNELHDIVLGEWSSRASYRYKDFRRMMPGWYLKFEGFQAPETPGCEEPRCLLLCGEMVLALARADYAQLERVAAKWAEPADWAQAGITSARLECWVKDIAWLARDGIGAPRRLLVWMCEMREDVVVPAGIWS